jgi:hypothetical protein
MKSFNSVTDGGWRSPMMLLILMSIAMPVAFNAWSALLNNFVVERAAFTGVEIGILQSLREVPGFLAFTTVFVLLVLREQTFAVLSLALLGLGVAATGFFPSEYGLYFTTVVMSIGFHYFEVAKQSLSLQWLSKAEAPAVLGKLIAVGSITFSYRLLSIVGVVRSFRARLCMELCAGRWRMCRFSSGNVAGVPAFSSKNRSAQVAHIAQTLLALLRTDVFVWCAAANFCRVRRIFNGREVRL